MYVKLSDLEEVSNTWLVNNPKVMTSMSRYIQGSFPRKQEFVNLMTFRLDRVLYEEGVYMSPDLMKPVLSGFTYTIFSLAFAVGMAFLAIGKLGVRK